MDASAQDSEHTSKSVLLIVEDDEPVARTLERLLRGPFQNHICPRIETARGWLGDHRSLAGAVVDLNLPDGSGLDFIEDLQKVSPKIPILLLTGVMDPEAINRAQVMGVPYVVKPDFDDNIGLFLRQLIVESAPGTRNIESDLARLSKEFRLSSRETQILAAAARGIPRGKIAEVLGTSENTIKSQVRSLLDKTNKNNLPEVVWLIHGDRASE
jgi:DNA-binding NarL/FixJ family response regulator